MLASIFLIAWLYFMSLRWVYTKILNNCLEIFFLCNLCITSTVMLLHACSFQRVIAPPQHAIFISSEYSVYSGVVLYHAQRWLFRTRAGVLQFKRDNKDIEELQRPAV